MKYLQKSKIFLAVGLSALVMAFYSPIIGSGTSDYDFSRFDGVSDQELSVQPGYSEAVWVQKNMTEYSSFSVGEVLEILDNQQAFGFLLKSVRLKFEDIFSSGYTKNHRFFIQVKGVAPAFLYEMIEDSGLDIQVIQGKLWSENELVTLSNELHSELRKLFENKLETWPDAVNGEIVVYSSDIKVKEYLYSPSLKQYHIDLNRIGVKLKFQFDLSMASSLDALYGGGYLSSCTAGFPVKNASYANGLLTAEHCNNSQTYLPSRSLSFRAEGTSKDVQWHSSSVTVDPKFYKDAGSLSLLLAQSSPYVGLVLCKFGKTTAKTCDSVYQLNVTSGVHTGLTAMSTRQAASGDSGGPWYYGTTAYGVHSGAVTLSSVKRDVFTPISATLNTLNVQLKFSPYQ